MTSRADFDEAEWRTVTEGPAIAALIVVVAERGGTLRESLAVGKAYAEAAQEHRGIDLLGEIVERAPRLHPRDFSSREALRSEGLEKIRAAVAILDAKASAEEVDAYKRFVISVAERVAAADKSGGVLGVGGERVGTAENQALDELAATLDVDRGELTP